MPRIPKSRQIVLDTAARIVRERGAANLTFEELSEASGVTRGGITYHFASKRDLLTALLLRDIEQWQQREQAAGIASNDVLGSLLHDVRMHLNDNDEKRRFVSGMLSAVAHDASLLEPVRLYHRAKFANVVWDQATLRRQLLRLAAEGLFWSDVFACSELPKGVRAKLVKELETLATEWSPAQQLPKTTRKKK